MVRFTGECPHEEHVEARFKAVELMHKTGVLAILGDLRDMTVAPSVRTMDLKEFGASWDEAGAPPGMSLAPVLPKDAISQLDVRYATNIARSKGTRVRLFHSMEDARNWLTASG